MNKEEKSPFELWLDGVAHSIRRLPRVLANKNYVLVLVAIGFAWLIVVVVEAVLEGTVAPLASGAPMTGSTAEASIQQGSAGATPAGGGDGGISNPTRPAAALPEHLGGQPQQSGVQTAGTVGAPNPPAPTNIETGPVNDGVRPAPSSETTNRSPLAVLASSAENCGPNDNSSAAILGTLQRRFREERLPGNLSLAMAVRITDETSESIATVRGAGQFVVCVRGDDSACTEVALSCARSCSVKRGSYDMAREAMRDEFAESIVNAIKDQPPTSGKPAKGDLCEAF